MAKGKAVKMEDMPPTLNVSEEQLPALKKWKVGKTYKMIVEAEQVETSKGSPFDDDGKMRAVFKIKSIKPKGNEDPLQRDLHNAKNNDDY